MASRKRDGLLKISDVAKEAGVLPSTVRYYTDLGLIQPASETPGGHRLYDSATTIGAIRKIQFSNKQGKTIDDIKQDLIATDGAVRKVLVIDDEIELCEVVTEMVKTYFPHYEVRVANDGFTAGRILNEYLPDLIILDLMLPGVNGFDVCRQIRSNEYMKGTKILAITGYDSDENKQKILSCGANDFLAKPMDVPVLKSKMEKLLQ